MIVGGVVWGLFFVFSVCVCLGVQRGLSRVLIKYSGNVRLQKKKIKIKMKVTEEKAQRMSPKLVQPDSKDGKEKPRRN